MDSYDIAIIGAGFSGTMVAINLARLSSGKVKIALLDRNPAPARGVAYGTTDLQHLLNVRSVQMGAFPDDPGHFWKWLQSHPGTGTIAASDFVPRLLYGQYLQDILKEAQVTYPNLTVLQRDITDMRRSEDGSFELNSPTGVACWAKSVVLALGNFPPGEKTEKAKNENPYLPEVWQRLTEPGDVLIIGTGLTSLDLVMTLACTKKTGKIHLLSRRALLPRVHIMPTPYASFIDPAHLPVTALALCRLVRKEIKKAQTNNVPWQNVVDALRPLNQRLWEYLSEKEQKRFLRFLRPYWDVHRHRCAPEVMAVYDKLKVEGRIVLHRGHIVAQNRGTASTEIQYRPSGTTSIESFRVRHIVNGTGPQSDCRKLDDVLVQNLLARDLIAPDRLHIGIATTRDYHVLNKDSQPIAGLYALGSLLKGRLYESVAVPELRVQAHDVAKIIAEQSPS